MTYRVNDLWTYRLIDLMTYRLISIHRLIYTCKLYRLYFTYILYRFIGLLTYSFIDL